MQHLSVPYEGLPIQPVNYFENQLEECLERSRQNSGGYHGYAYQDFVNFPTAHGYGIDSGYRLKIYAGDVSCGHGIQSPGQEGLRQSLTQEEFLQAWLYFGLLRCIVRGTEPLLRSTTTDDRRRLSTHDLPDALTKWERYLGHLHGKAADEAKSRCIEAIMMLTLAKRVVQANLTDPEHQLRTAPQGDKDESVRSLCLMVLGETLTAALQRIMKLHNIRIRNWELDSGGWGPPKFVLDTMREAQFCERFKHVLRGQIGPNATMIYATEGQLSLHAQKRTGDVWFNHGNEHNCTTDKCHYIEANQSAGINSRDGRDTSYKPLHHPHCDSPFQCQLVGPDEMELMNILKEAEREVKNPDEVLREATIFPLLKIRPGEEGGLTVDVERWEPGKKFATVSHVWAHGLGNMQEPKIWTCQLKHIQDLLHQLKGGGDAVDLFWLDTLALPAVDGPGDEGEYRKRERTRLRRAAVRSIFAIFDHADHSHGIIIDRHLLHNPSYTSSQSIGLALLSSAWMKRLWTLQEAFVTRNLSIALENGTTRSYEELWDEKPVTDETTDKARRNMNRVMKGMIKEKLEQNLMGEERAWRRSGTDYPRSRNERGSLLVASAWSSARFREIGRAENETLALASLLNLRVPKEKTYGPQGSKENDKRRDLMADFWVSIHGDERLEGAIPSGMVFLPPPRLPRPGFGWAPDTWLSSADEAYPYPLTSYRFPTSLDGRDRGLIVQYPGYIIHATVDKRGLILGREGTPNAGFEFSVSLGLYDWYRAVPMEKEEHYEPRQKLLERLKNDQADYPELAIILSRPRPVETPGEVGLLVEIYDGRQPKQEGRADAGADGDSTYYCRIIRRLTVSRRAIPHHNGNNSGRSPLDIYTSFESSIVGESVSDTQKWCIDSYHYTPKPPPDEEQHVESGARARNDARKIVAEADAPPRRAPGRPVQALQPPTGALENPHRAQTSSSVSRLLRAATGVATDRGTFGKVKAIFRREKAQEHQR